MISNRINDFYSLEDMDEWAARDGGNNYNENIDDINRFHQSIANFRRQPSM